MQPIPQLANSANKRHNQGGFFPSLSSAFQGWLYWGASSKIITAIPKFIPKRDNVQKNKFPCSYFTKSFSSCLIGNNWVKWLFTKLLNGRKYELQIGLLNVVAHSITWKYFLYWWNLPPCPSPILIKLIWGKDQALSLLKSLGWV